MLMLLHCQAHTPAMERLVQEVDDLLQAAVQCEQLHLSRTIKDKVSTIWPPKAHH